MKVKKLTIKNIGLIADTTIQLDKPLILFYGEIMQGKTTILNAVKFCFGGSYPEDIIRHGEKDASVTLEFEGGSINREWYKAKDGSTAVRPITFIKDGKPVKKPVDEIKKFLNPFLLDQDYLRKMTELERKTYFTQLFAVDTSDIDKQLFSAENEARDLRVKIKTYGEIDLTEVKPIDIDSLKVDLEGIRAKYSIAVNDVIEENKKIVQFNGKVESAMEDIQAWSQEELELEKRLNELRTKINDLVAWVTENPHKKELPLPNPPDTSDLESKINEGIANKIRVQQYQKNLARAQEKKTDEESLAKLESKGKDLKKSKTARLSKISQTCGINELVFDETGSFTYQGTTAGMLSGSQIMRLSEELSNLYPKDLGISLIDRGESLGKSIFEFVDKAQKEEKTILATIVGEKPAQIPEHVGVFVVDKGEVKA